VGSSEATLEHALRDDYSDAHNAGMAGPIEEARRRGGVLTGAP
jgi:hypothetical protein